MGKKHTATEPVRDINEVFRIADTLRGLEDGHGRLLYMLWVVGVNTGLRIGDLINLRVGDMREQNYSYLPEKQRNKRGARNVTIPVPDDVRALVRERCAGIPDDAWLFPSRKRKRERHPSPVNPNVPKKARRNVGAISRQTAWAWIQEIRKICGVEMPMGCHTMRKTFGYHYYRAGGTLAQLQEWFQHDKSSTTLIYIGATTDDLRDMVNKSPFRGMTKKI